MPSYVTSVSPDLLSESFKHFKQILSVSLSQCKEYQTRALETDGLQINRAYFSVPHYLLMMSDYHAIENLGPRTSWTIDLKQQRRIYTELPLALPIDDPKKAHEALLANLNSLRSAHRESSSSLRQRIRRVLVDAISEDDEGRIAWNEGVHLFIMKVYNELLRSAMPEIRWKRPCQCEEVIEEFRFVAELIQLFLKKTNNFKPAPAKPHLIHWFNNVRELLMILLNSTYYAHDMELITLIAE